MINKYKLKITYINLITFMTFFLEGHRNTDFPVKPGPSPSHYQTHREFNKSHAYAPFGSTTKLSRSNQKHNHTLKTYNQQHQQALLDQVTMRSMAKDQMAAVFRSRSQRFIGSNKNVPGPGSYNLASQNKIKRKQKSMIHLDNYQSQPKHTIPSMPLDNLGYKYDKKNNIQKVKIKGSQPPVPGSYELRQSMVKENGLNWKERKTKGKKQQEEPIPGPGTYETQPKKIKAPSSCFQSKIDRFNQKKIKKSYQPGPGDYNPLQTQPVRQFSESHFNSKAMRFKPSTSAIVGPGSYYNDQSVKTFKNKNSINIPVGEPQRKTIFSINNKNPGPGQYVARDGMTFELQKALLRKHNLSQFPNSKRQVFGVKEQEQPGPGAYNPEIPNKNTPGTISNYKKVEVVNLKEGEEEFDPSPFDYNIQNHTIQKKIADSNHKLTLTDKKPFDSGVERFKHYNQNIARQENNKNYHHTHDTQQYNQSVDDEQKTRLNFEDSTMKKTKKLIMTSVKVKVPFGSSAPKYQEREGQGVGPGYYNNGSQWIKSTFSLKGKIVK